MKKLLGISIVAMLAVSPMMANAAQEAAPLSPSTAVNGDATAIATAAYVKGAYDAAADAINDIVTDIDVTTDGSAMNGQNKMLQATASVAENLANVDTKIGAFTNEASGGIIANENSVSSNLKALEGRLLTAESDIDTLESNVGTVANLSSANGFDTSELDPGETLDLVTAVTQAMPEAKSGVAANSIVVYGGWNGGAAPKGASAITTQTASDAATAVATANQ